MFESILNEVLRLGDQVFSAFHQFNVWLLQNFGGILLLAALLAAIAAWRNTKRNKESKDVLRKLAEAIIRQHNKELREGK